MFESMKELLTKMKQDGYHISFVSKRTGVSYNRLYQCVTGSSELRESDLRALCNYAKSVGYEV